MRCFIVKDTYTCIVYVEDSFFNLAITNQTITNSFDHLFVRKDGKPNYLIFFADHSYVEACVIKNGIYHSLNGPARTSYSPDGEIISEQYYIYGSILSEEEYNMSIKNYEIIK